ncbi:MAG: Crp/Fnr family transcriptional regulator [Desulfovibrio sp.]|nr:Crp/Fnr family transcriptional regulator [Desulfovibrio sp.]
MLMDHSSALQLEQALRLGSLAVLSDEERQALARHAHIQSFATGEVLIREGDDSADVMLLLQGMVKLCRHSTQGKECVLHLVRSGRILDAGVLFYEEILPFSAVALHPCAVLRIEKKPLLDCLQRNPNLCLALLRGMSLRQRLLINKIAGSQGRILVASRVAAWLLHRARMEKSATLELHVTQETLARQMGISRESLSRELSALHAVGLIERTRRRIVLLDSDALKLRARS